MSYFKLLNIETNTVVAVGYRPLLRYVKLNLNGLPISCDISHKDCFGIAYDGIVYNLHTKEKKVDGFDTVSIQSIDISEYNLLNETLKNITDEDEVIPTVLIDTTTIETFRQGVINKLKIDCKLNIEDGFEVTFNDHTEHFDLTIEDQLNLQSIQLQLFNGADSVMYHCKGGKLRVYEREELLLIINGMYQHISSHNNYFNLIKHYVNSLNTTTELSEVEYGMELPQEITNA